MRTFDVQSIELQVPRERAFAYIADPRTLPAWTEAFVAVAEGRATMRGPDGTSEVGLEVSAAADPGTIDWRMEFPDGIVASAASRLVSLDEGRCVLTFVLPAPPVPLERLEGTLEAQSRTLAGELARLKRILEEGRE